MFGIIDTAINITVFTTVIYLTASLVYFIWFFIKKEINMTFNKFIKVTGNILKALFILLLIYYSIWAVYSLNQSAAKINYDFIDILQIIICFIVYIFIKMLRIKTFDNIFGKEFLTKRNPENKYGTVFTCIDMMNTHLESNKIIADKIMASTEKFERISEISLNVINNGALILNDYFNFQNKKIKILYQKQNFLLNSFDDIIVSNIKIKESISDIHKKMNFTLKALNYFEESDRILSEMLDLTRENFNRKARLNNEIFEKQVSLILEKINNITFSYSDKNFIDIFTNSYGSTVSNYWQRINTAITHYENVTNEKMRLLSKTCLEMYGFFDKESEYFIKLHKSCSEYLEKNKKIISIMLNTYKNENLKPTKLKIALNKLNQK